MPTSRPATKKLPRQLPPEARILLLRLRHENRDASPAQWDELRAKLRGSLALTGGDDAKAGLLEQAFDQLRDEALRARVVQRARTALANGLAQRQSTAGQWEEYIVPLEPTASEPTSTGEPASATQIAGPADPSDTATLHLLVPAPDAALLGADVARAALLRGRCTLCKAELDVIGDEVVIPHKRKCVAANVSAT